jgi:hypothetical protein
MGQKNITHLYEVLEQGVSKGAKFSKNQMI